jgi:hypothetical protein
LVIPLNNPAQALASLEMTRLGISEAIDELRDLIAGSSYPDPEHAAHILSDVRLHLATMVVGPPSCECVQGPLSLALLATMRGAEELNEFIDDEIVPAGPPMPGPPMPGPTLRVAIGAGAGALRARYVDLMAGAAIVFGAAAFTSFTTSYDAVIREAGGMESGPEAGDGLPNSESK